VLQQQLGPAAAPYQQAYLGLPSNCEDSTLAAELVATAAELAAAAVEVLREHLKLAWCKVQTAKTPAAMQLTLQVLLLLCGIGQLQQQQQQQESDPQAMQQEQQQMQQHVLQQRLTRDLWVLLHMQQLAGCKAAAAGPAAVAAWPWQVYLQVELLALQAAMAGGPGQQHAGIAAATAVYELWCETPGELLCVCTSVLPVCCLQATFNDA
jgi:hypothetical protein